jgi:hypothetical protein
VYLCVCRHLKEQEERRARSLSSLRSRSKRSEKRLICLILMVPVSAVREGLWGSACWGICCHCRVVHFGYFLCVNVFAYCKRCM